MSKKHSVPPARSPKERENQLINLAMNLAQRQLEDGSASSQVISHFLKLGTVREQLENDRLRSDLELKEAKIKDLENRRDVGDLYEKAINAMKLYSGYGGSSDVS